MTIIPASRKTIRPPGGVAGRGHGGEPPAACIFAEKVVGRAACNPGPPCFLALMLTSVAFARPFLVLSEGLDFPSVLSSDCISVFNRHVPIGRAATNG